MIQQLGGIRYAWAQPDMALQQFRHLLQPDDLRELNQTKRSEPEQQRRFAARSLLRLLLHEVGGNALGSEKLHRHAKGGLSLQPKGRYSVSISHTFGLVAACISPTQGVGIDVERDDPHLDREGIALRFFHPDEYNGLTSLQDAEHRNQFFSLWTCKEAVAKAIGQGLERDLPMASFSIQFDRSLIHLVKHLPPPFGAMLQTVHTLPAPDGFHAAIAATV